MLARDIFETCCAGIENAARKRRLIRNAAQVESAAHDYSEAGKAGTIHHLSPATYQPLGTATGNDFVWLYDQRLVDSVPGRVYYEQLRDANKDGRCSLCNVRPAGTLDHHLPKADHPLFALTPDNLLPACRDCNSIKLQDKRPTLNCYFDDLGADPWLRLEVIPTDPWIPRFFIQAQADWSLELAVRAQNHFDLFGLQEFYAYQANRQIAGISDRLAKLLANQGIAGVRGHLEGEAESWQKNEPNSWEAALYTGLAASDWFCSGGFAR